MKKIENISLRSFQAVLQAFNAPFLTMLSGCVGYMEIQDALVMVHDNIAKIEETWVLDNFEIMGKPDNSYLHGEDGWSFDWISRSGKLYEFGLAEKDHNSFFVQYPKDGKMAAMIEHICLDIPIAAEIMELQPYLGSPYLRRFRQQASEI
jgi:hypothetical protein